MSSKARLCALAALSFLSAVRAEEERDAAQPLLVILAPNAEVSSLSITLGDVARLGGKNEVYRELAASLRLGYAPIPGTERTFSRAFLEDRLVAAGLPRDAFRFTGSKTCVVRGVASVLEAERFERTACEFVLERLKAAGIEGRTCRVLGGARPAALPARFADGTWKAEFVGRPAVSGRARIQVRVEQEGLTVVRQIVDVEIREAEVGSREEEATPAVVEPVAPAPSRERRPTSEVDVVRRGDSVEVVSVVGKVQVTTRGRARRGGKVGEVVEVELLDPRTGRRSSELTGRVEGPGRVRVLEGGGVR